MRSIQQLRDAIKKEQDKANGLRNDAQKHRDKAMGYDPSSEQPRIISENDAAQKLDEQAATHDQLVQEFQAEITRLEQKALELERKKQDLIAAKQAQVDQIDAEEKMIRGETRTLL